MNYYLDRKKDGVYFPVLEAGTKRLKTFKYNRDVATYVKARPGRVYKLGRLAGPLRKCQS